MMPPPCSVIDEYRAGAAPHLLGGSCLPTIGILFTWRGPRDGR